MQETASTTAVLTMEEEDRYVKVGSRFFRLKKTRDGGAAMDDSCFHYLGSCFLCKKTIDCSRDIFMYKGDAAFCSEDCRDDQMDMDEALDAVARRQRLLRTPPSSSYKAVGEATPPMMRRRPTIANLAARNPPVVAR